jgi:hypothetical protein
MKEESLVPVSPTPLDLLKAIPEEEIWLQSQKPEHLPSACRCRRKPQSLRLARSKSIWARLSVWSGR